MTQLNTVYKKLTLNISYVESKGWKKIYHANVNQKIAGEAM